MTKKTPDREQKKVRDKAKKELERLEGIDEKTIQMIDQFKYRFNICETIYKVILLEYKRKKGLKIKSSDLRLNMKEVPAALRFAGYDFKGKEYLLAELFGSKRPNSQKGKTAKKLRDAVTHGISNSAITEIKNRQIEVFNYMDSFIGVIKKFDSQ